MVLCKVSVPGMWPRTSDWCHLSGHLSRLQEDGTAHGQSAMSWVEPRWSFPMPWAAAPPWGSVMK